MCNRPTVYAGMSGKPQRNDSQDDQQQHNHHLAYNDLINQYVDNSIDSGINLNAQHYIDQFYHSNNTSGAVSKRNSAALVQSKQSKKPIKNIMIQNNLNLPNEYSDDNIFIREDIQVYPMTAKEKSRIKNLTSGRNSQRTGSNNSTNGHKRNQYSYDHQQLNLVSKNYNRNVPS